MSYTVDLRGAQLAIITPSGQPAEILFDFDTTDVSAYTWLGQIRADQTSTTPLAVFDFTFPTVYQVLASVSEVAVGALTAGAHYRYEIDQVSPTHRQMFYGLFLIVQDTARPVVP